MFGSYNRGAPTIPHEKSHFSIKDRTTPTSRQFNTKTPIPGGKKVGGIGLEPTTSSVYVIPRIVQGLHTPHIVHSFHTVTICRGRRVHYLHYFHGVFWYLHTNYPRHEGVEADLHECPDLVGIKYWHLLKIHIGRCHACLLI